MWDPMSTATIDLKPVLHDVAAQARRAAVFGDVVVGPAAVRCAAKDCESHAEYRIAFEDGRWWVSFVTPDRWLSESIEADLMHTGDRLEELLEEELAEVGLDASLPFEHYRSEDKLFTFRSPLPLDGAREARQAAEVAAKCLLGYEACFRELGDVAGGREDD